MIDTTIESNRGARRARGETDPALNVVSGFSRTVVAMISPDHRGNMIG
jgi:hypothetical protein